MRIRGGDDKNVSVLYFCMLVGRMRRCRYLFTEFHVYYYYYYLFFNDSSPRQIQLLLYYETTAAAATVRNRDGGPRGPNVSRGRLATAIYTTRPTRRHQLMLFSAQLTPPPPRWVCNLRWWKTAVVPYLHVKTKESGPEIKCGIRVYSQLVFTNII